MQPIVLGFQRPTVAPYLAWLGLLRNLRPRWRAFRDLTAILLAAGVLVAGARAIERQTTDLLLVDVTARAVDQAGLVLLEEVDPADLSPPLDEGRLAALDSHLTPLLQHLRRPDSGIVRINLYAADGTLISGDHSDRRGERVAPEDAPMLSRALSGSLVAERTDLEEIENADLKPLAVEGRVLGAYEVYANLAPVARVRAGLWALVFVLSGVCAGVLLARRAPARAWFVTGTRPRSAPPAPVPVLQLEAAAPVLSRREGEVLCLLASGHSYREIAERLVLSEDTVHSHVKRIFRKLGQRNRTQAVLAAMQRGLVRLEAPTDQRGEG